MRRINDDITLTFTTHNPNTGEVSDADSTPTSVVYEDDTDTEILSPTVTKRTGATGVYRLTFSATTANGFEVSKSYSIVVTAIVDGVTAKATIESFQLENYESIIFII